MNPKKQYKQKENAPRSQRKDFKRYDIQTLESKMPHDMSSRMESQQTHKESRETSLKRKIKVWRPKIGGLIPLDKTGDLVGKESLEEEVHSLEDDHYMVEENPSVKEDLEMALLLC